MVKRTHSEFSSDNDVVAPSPTRPRLASEIPATASEDLTRILSWNVETPVPFLQLTGSKARSAANATPGIAPGSKPALLRDLIRRHGFPDFVCLQEVRARHTDKEWISALRLAANFGAQGERMFKNKSKGAVSTGDRKSTRLNSSHSGESRMPSSA